MGRLSQKREKAWKKQRIIQAVRDWFTGKKFLEVHTPSFVARYSGEPYLEPFLTGYTDHRGDNFPGFLAASPEIHLKKLLAEGFEKIYEICRCFRNREDPASPHHNAEFLMLEWYRLAADYTALMDDVKEIFLKLAGEFGGGSILEYNGRRYDLSNWYTLTMQEAFLKFAGIDFCEFQSWNDLVLIASKRGLGKGLSLDDAFYLLFLNEIEPRLTELGPCFICDYPEFQASNAVVEKRGNLSYARRFEVYIGGLEIANAFSELCDADEQRRRFEENNRLRTQTGRTPYPPDEDYLTALDNIDAAAGIALGLDRLVMLFTGSTDISEVILFPVKDLFR